MSPPSSDAMSAPRAIRDVRLHVLLHFLARGLLLALPEHGYPSFLGPLLHCALFINWCQQWSYGNRFHRGPAQVLSGPASENSAHPMRQLVSLPASQASTRCALDGDCNLPRLVVDEGLVLTQVDLISGLCDLGNAQERTFTWQTSQTILGLCPSYVREGWDLLQRLGRSSLPLRGELGFSGIHRIMFSGSVFASAPLSTTAEIFTIPFLVRSSATCPKTMSFSSSHSDPRTVPLLSKHPRRLEHCWRFRDLRVTTVHPASLNASRSPGGELIKQDSLPRYPSWSVSSSSSVQQPSSLVLQVINPSFTGAQPRGVSLRTRSI